MYCSSHFQPYVGQRLVVHTTNGVTHHGYLHSVNQSGIYLRSIQNSGMMMSGSRFSSDTTTAIANSNTNLDVDDAFFPFFFLPFLAIAAFSPWFWW